MKYLLAYMLTTGHLGRICNDTNGSLPQWIPKQHDPIWREVLAICHARYGV